MLDRKPWWLASAALLTVAVATTAILLASRPAEAHGIFAGLDVTVVTAPECSCCHLWIAELEARGATVTRVTTDDLVGAKTARAVPATVWSCHTADFGGYAVEGHVPMDALERLLAERPAVDGIGLAGMPSGSPGMPGPKTAPFEVMSFVDGAHQLFGRY